MLIMCYIRMLSQFKFMCFLVTLSGAVQSRPHHFLVFPTSPSLPGHLIFVCNCTFDEICEQYAIMICTLYIGISFSYIASSWFLMKRIMHCLCHISYSIELDFIRQERQFLEIIL